MKKEKLSNRIRPNSEVLPWIYEEIKLLENQLDEERLICETQSSMLEYQAKRNAELANYIENMRVVIEVAYEALKAETEAYCHTPPNYLLSALAKLKPFSTK